MLQIVKRLLYVIPASKVSLVGMVFLFIFSSGLEVVGIGAIAPFISLATKPQLIYEYMWLEKLYGVSAIADENRFIAFLGLVVVLLFCIKIVVAWLTQIAIFRFSSRQQRLLINKLLDKYLSAPYTYHLDKGNTYVTDSIIEIANKFNFIVQPLFVTTANICVAVSLLTLLWFTSSMVMVTLLVMILPVMLFFNYFKRKVRAWGEQNRSSKGNILKTINHSLGGIKETKVIGCEDYFIKELARHTKRLESSQTGFFGFGILPRYLIETVILTSTIGIIAYYLFVGQGVNELQGILGVYAVASIRLLPAFTQAIGGVNALRNNSFTIDQIYFDLKELRKESRYLATSQTSKNSLGANNKLAFERAITLENISYQYPNQKDKAIRDLSLTIAKGESIAFIGKSGAGKTTLVDVILGLLTLQSGDITVDGASIYTNLRAWQNMIGYVPQTIFLIDGTLKQNIAFGVPDLAIDEERLTSSIKAAQLSDLVDELPLGWDTKVGERGVLLSGGQRQRIGIARVLYHNRDVLVFDEATAALDNETENLVSEAIKSLIGIKTTILIAHRLSTVEHCDRIYMLDKGRIIRAGSYKEVVLH